MKPPAVLQQGLPHHFATKGEVTRDKLNENFRYLSDEVAALKQDLGGNFRSAPGSLKLTEFPELLGTSVRSQTLGAFPACFLVQARSIDYDNSCGCLPNPEQGAAGLSNSALRKLGGVLVAQRA